MAIDNDGLAMGFFLLNSNAMQVNTQPDPAITFITTGGIIDVYIYLGPTPADIVKQHTDIIGRSFLPAYFTLGFHLVHLVQIVRN
jgi:alpha-glucosidase (family GH31 glycosyl hydrolase)